MKIKRGCVVLFLLLSEALFAQQALDYYPLHVGDYWVQHADTILGEYQPTTSRTEIEAIDLIRGKEYFRMRQRVTTTDGSDEWDWYTWLRPEAAGIVIGAFGETPEVVEMIIPTRNITVDGDPSDWSGINPLVTDPQGDDSPSYTGDDIKALYIARDADYLFLRMDLWDNVNTNFGNGSAPEEGRYSFTIFNNGPYDGMQPGIAYNKLSSQWSLGYNGSSDHMPPGVEGPFYVGVSGSVIELRIPLSAIDNPSSYYEIQGEVTNYTLPGGGVLDEARIRATSIYDPPLLWAPNAAGTPGYSWEFNASDMGGHYLFSVESISETVQVPAGTFKDCIKIKLLVTEPSGDTFQINHYYYAKGVGQVLSTGWSEWWENFKFELMEYFVQTVQVEYDTTVTAGKSLNLTVTPPQNFQPTTRRLYYRSAGQRNWHYINLNPSGNQYEVTIPADSVTCRGIEYYVYLSDGLRVVTYPEFTPETNPAVIQVAVSQYASPVSFEEMTYKMISVPLELSNPQISAVLGDDYGSYNTQQWRLFRWQGGDYVEYPAIKAAFTPGTAFWLITRSGKTFDVENGLSVNSSGPYTITLQPGWNQVANPFAFPVATDSVNVPTGVEKPVYYDGREYHYDRAVIYPWEGYFVYNTNSTPVTISIPPVEVEAGLEKLMAIDPANEYLLQVSAEMPGTRLIDTQNYLGLLKNATEGRDELDFSEAPPIGDYLWVSIVENEERFAGNFKPLQGNGQQWELEIGATLPQRPVQMTLTETGRLPENFRLYILDKDYHCILPAKNKTINFYLDQEFPVRHLKVIVGTEEYAEGQADGIPLVPLEYHLAQNYPNPFSATGKSTIGGTGGTTIEYQLGKRSLVMLEIYNILGHRVRTLANEVQNTGHHSVRWNGLNDAAVPVTSGVYFYRLKAGEFTTTRKLVVIQ